MFIIKQGDLFPSIEIVVKDENGTVVDVSEATATFSMRPARNPSALKIDGADAVVPEGTDGKVRYDPAEGDTDTPGTYEGEFLVTPGGTDPPPAFRVPSDGYLEIVVEAAIVE